VWKGAAMPKKLGTSTKVVESRERKAAQAAEKDSKKKKQEEDEYWKDDAKHVVKKEAKKQTEQQKKEETLRKKQELKDLLAAEEATQGAAAAKKAVPAKKVTKAELDKKKEQERQRLKELADQQAKEKAKITIAPEIEPENPNQKMATMLEEEGGIEARSVTEAISVLAVGEPGEASAADKHPEKRMKAAYQAFEDQQLPILKQENPSLKRSQLKQMLWKEWQKHPENPLNQHLVS